HEGARCQTTNDRPAREVCGRTSHVVRRIHGAWYTQVRYAVRRPGRSSGPRRSECPDLPPGGGGADRGDRNLRIGRDPPVPAAASAAAAQFGAVGVGTFTSTSTCSGTPESPPRTKNIQTTTAST